MNDSKPEAQADYRVETCAPGDLTAVEMERCTRIVIEGEAITDPESVKKWLPRSVVLAVVRKGEEIVAVGAIKPARPPYARQVAAASEHGSTAPERRPTGAAWVPISATTAAMWCSSRAPRTW